MAEIQSGEERKGIDESKKIRKPFSLAFVKRIFFKDWKEIRGNRELFLPIIFIPIIFSVVLPFVVGIGAIVEPSEFGVATKYEAIKMMLDLMMKPMFLMIPTIITMIIASDSFAGEKERKTAETLLVLPITHKELYLAKVLAAFLPSIVFSTLSFIIMGIEINIMAMGDVPSGAPPLIFGDITFWMVAFVLGTLFSLTSVQFGIMISARSKNTKSAQSISGVIIVPLMGLLFGSMFNPTLLSDPWILLLLTAILGSIVYVLQIIGSRVINREKLIANIG
ncbi:MAG: ABC transporter permease subunit [Promethearchaeota archaeon]